MQAMHRQRAQLGKEQLFVFIEMPPLKINALGTRVFISAGFPQGCRQTRLCRVILWKSGYPSHNGGEGGAFVGETRVTVGGRPRYPAPKYPNWGENFPRNNAGRPWATTNEKGECNAKSPLGALRCERASAGTRGGQGAIGSRENRVARGEGARMFMDVEIRAGVECPTVGTQIFPPPVAFLPRVTGVNGRIVRGGVISKAGAVVSTERVNPDIARSQDG